VCVIAPSVVVGMNRGVPKCAKVLTRCSERLPKREVATQVVARSYRSVRLLPKL
jgi:hypothetical protein